MSDNFSNNQNHKRFELQIGQAVAFANYRIQAGILYINYVEAPEALRGTGAAGRLMQHIVDHARTQNLKITPVCGYAASWLRRHDENNDLLA